MKLFLLKCRMYTTETIHENISNKSNNGKIIMTTIVLNQEKAIKNKEYKKINYCSLMQLFMMKLFQNNEEELQKYFDLFLKEYKKAHEENLNKVYESYQWHTNLINKKYKSFYKKLKKDNEDCAILKPYKAISNEQYEQIKSIFHEEFLNKNQHMIQLEDQQKKELHMVFNEIKNNKIEDLLYKFMPFDLVNGKKLHIIRTTDNNIYICIIETLNGNVIYPIFSFEYNKNILNEKMFQFQLNEKEILAYIINKDVDLYKIEKIK